jgi:hypothetical protein
VLRPASETDNSMSVVSRRFAEEGKALRAGPYEKANKSGVDKAVVEVDKDCLDTVMHRLGKRCFL